MTPTYIDGHITDLKQFDANDEDVLVTLEAFLTIRETLEEYSLADQAMLDDLNKRFLKAFPDAPKPKTAPTSYVPLPPATVGSFSNHGNTLGYVVTTNDNGKVAEILKHRLFDTPTSAQNALERALMEGPDVTFGNIHSFLEKYKIVNVVKAR